MACPRNHPKYATSPEAGHGQKQTAQSLDQNDIASNITLVALPQPSWPPPLNIYPYASKLALKSTAAAGLQCAFSSTVAV
ncbi:unnamed protein product [Ectocarpus sp. 8 AP-2014]